MIYRINGETGNIVEDRNNLGKIFYKDPWRLATQEEVNEWVLDKSKADKLQEAKGKLAEYIALGYHYISEASVDYGRFDFNDKSIVNVLLKCDMPSGDEYKYQYCNKTGAVQNFVDAAGFLDFKKMICQEKDRVMVKYNNVYKKDIAAIEITPEKTFEQAMAELAAIDINYN